MIHVCIFSDYKLSINPPYQDDYAISDKVTTHKYLNVNQITTTKSNTKYKALFMICCDWKINGMVSC